MNQVWVSRTVPWKWMLWQTGPRDQGVKRQTLDPQSGLLQKRGRRRKNGRRKLQQCKNYEIMKRTSTGFVNFYWHAAACPLGCGLARGQISVFSPFKVRNRFWLITAWENQSGIKETFVFSIIEKVFVFQLKLAYYKMPGEMWELLLLARCIIEVSYAPIGNRPKGIVLGLVISFLLYWIK